MGYQQVCVHEEHAVIRVDLAEAAARLSDLLDKVEAGEEVVITRNGRVAARMQRVSHPKSPLPLDELAAFRATMPRWRKSSAALLRAARDEER